MRASRTGASQLHNQDKLDLTETQCPIEVLVWLCLAFLLGEQLQIGARLLILDDIASEVRIVSFHDCTLSSRARNQTSKNKHAAHPRNLVKAMPSFRV